MNGFYKSIWFGLIMGIFTTIVGSAIVMMIFELLAKLGVIQYSSLGFSPTQERTIYVLGIFMNIIPFQYFKKVKAEKAMNGVVIVTILAVAVWIIYYYKSLF
ncbi:MAG TPA: hypothetical protein ENK91_12725 [Bacteroidetes bacterium]|nr:hypothetical protein [Bacteroidota bacterium]